MKANVVKIICSVILGALLLTSCGKNNTPDEEQLRADFSESVLSDDEMSVSEFSVELEQDEETLYKAIVNVVYDNGKVEYEEKYQIIYEKYDEWVLNDIEDYEKNSWSKKPLVAPEPVEFKNQCLSELYDEGQFSEYDTFKALDDEAEVDLDEGKAIFVFAVSNQSAIQKVSGKIEFDIEFDYKREVWVVEGYRYSESYAVEHDLTHFWQGKGPHCGTHGWEIVEEEFAFSINEFDGEIASAILTFRGKQYPVSGKISILGGTGDYYGFDMNNENERMRIEGFISIEGELSATVDTAYVPDSMFFYLKDRYNVEMFIIE